MIIALAPRLSRGCSWVWLSIVLLGLSPWAVQAQTKPPAEKPKEAAEKGAEAPAEDEKPADAEEAAAVQEEVKSSVEVFVDPIAVKANENTFPQLPAGNFNIKQIRDVEAMAKGAAVDRDLIQKYVTKYTADLTNHRYIKGLIDPAPGANPNSSEAVGFREASTYLANPIELAKKGNRAAFLKVYTEALLAQAPKLLKNHLLARIEMAILLGKTGSPDAIDTFIAQLNDKEQTVWVKLWAVRGLLNIMTLPNGGFQDLPGGPTATAKAAHAVMDWLAEEELPWPARLRAVEALGTLRMAADPKAQGKLEMASALMGILADPKARLEVRAQAAWALGMLRVSQANPKFNYKLVAFYAGEVAAGLGEKVTTTYSSNLSLAQFYASPLLFQIYPAFNGVDGVRESGLLRMPTLGQNRGYVEQVSNLIKPVAKASVELFKAAGGARPKAAKELSDRVAALKSFLEKNVPEDSQFGEKDFPLKAELARVPAGDPKVAGSARPQ